MAKAKNEDLEDRAVDAGLDPVEYGSDEALQVAVEEAEAEDDQGEGEVTEGVQPLTEDDIPESGR
jgi:hypothetical protein